MQQFPLVPPWLVKKVVRTHADLTGRSERMHRPARKRMAAVLSRREGSGADNRLGGLIAIEPRTHHQDAHGVVERKASFHDEGESDQVQWFIGNQSHPSVRSFSSELT